MSWVVSPSTRTPSAVDETEAPAVRTRTPFTPVELLVAWGLLGVLAIVAYLGHVRSGGFYLDDWSNGALSLHSGGNFFDVLHRYWDLTSYRPVLVLYVPLTYQLFGAHMGLHLAWAAGLSVCVSALLYGVLRTLTMARVHAWMIAALLLIFPWSDATRMWATAAQITLSMSFAFGGIWLALLSVERRRRRLQVLSLLLYALSVLTYEVTLPVLLLAGSLYVLKAPWSVAWRRWAVDVAVLGLCGLWVGTQTNRDSAGLHADFEHLRQIFDAGGVMLGRGVLATGPQRTALALCLLLAAGLAALALGRLLADPERRSDALRWLGFGVGGVVVAAAGWVMFIPADPYYTPSPYGVTNRVNGLAGTGIVLAAYSCAAIIGLVVSAVVARIRTSAPGRTPALAGTLVTVALGVALGATYLDVIHRHSKIWNDAYKAEAAGLGQIRGHFRDLPKGTVLYVAGYPEYQTLGVPIFSSTWDVNGMVRMQYRDGSLSAFPVFYGMKVACGRERAYLQGPGAPSDPPVAYARLALLNAATGETARPRNAAQCRQASPRFPPGPLYLSYEY
jgi:hypothetical protein